MAAAAFLNRGSSSRRRARARTDCSETSWVRMDRPAPSSTTRPATSGWSAPCGITSIGMPAYSASFTLFIPPWVTSSAVRSRTRVCGTKRRAIALRQRPEYGGIGLPGGQDDGAAERGERGGEVAQSGRGVEHRAEGGVQHGVAQPV
ncbi:hypothetical protein STENM327S_06646 [Streptomyces tendae]